MNLFKPTFFKDAKLRVAADDVSNGLGSGSHDPVNSVGNRIIGVLVGRDNTRAVSCHHRGHWVVLVNVQPDVVRSIYAFDDLCQTNI